MGCSASEVRNLATMSALAVEIEVRLDGAGAQHHVQAQRPDLGHIGAHDVIAALGHDRDLLSGPQRVETGAQEADADLIGDLLDLHQVLAGLVADVVDGQERRARQLQLAARLQADRGDETLGIAALQPDQDAVFLHAGPAEPLQPLKQGLDPASALIGGARQGILVEAELLVLGADAPLVLGLGALGHGLDQSVSGKRRVLGHL